MEKCPKCSKLSVDNDQCVACGIVVSKWLKLHSIVPPESTKQENNKPVYPHIPPAVKPKWETEQKEEKESLKPPDFVFDKDATLPIGALDDAKQAQPISQKPSVVTPEKRSDEDRIARAAQPLPKQVIETKAEIKKEQKASFLGQTEEELIHMRKDLKTDWEEYYKENKGKFYFAKNDDNVQHAFKLRNYLLSFFTLLIAILTINIKFFLKYGLGAEYSALQPLITLLAMIGVILSLGTFFTLRLKDVTIKNKDSKNPKISLHWIQIIQIFLIMSMIALIPVAPRLSVIGQSVFPILPDSEIDVEFLTGEGLGNFFRPVLAPDGSSLYAVQLYGQNAGFIIKFTGNQDYITITEGIKVKKFRFEKPGTVIYHDTRGLHRLNLNEIADDPMGAKKNSEKILEDRKIRDFDLSQDGKRIVFVEKNDLYISNYPFYEAEQLTQNPNEEDLMPSFYPDGNKILFIRNLVPNKNLIEEADPENNKYLDDQFPTENKGKEVSETLNLIPKNIHYQLFEFNITDNEELRITNDSYNYSFPLISPSLDKIAVVIEVPDHVTVRIGPIIFKEKAVVLMNIDGSARIRIFPPIETQFQGMHEMFWYPNGRKLLIGISALLQKGIYRVDI